MPTLKSLIFVQLFLAYLVSAHGGASHAHGSTQDEKENTNWKYAQRHMAKEHHIDSFDPKSFFALHDLNGDGFLDREEVEAIYGVHHVYSQKLSKDEKEQQEKADNIADTVLGIMDKNGDGKISQAEFVAAGVDALPTFEGLEGHHYDVESEFFLHHEEEFHSTPESQTDESYNHPEDLEHFAQHEKIEREEAAREAKFQGISVEEAIAAHNHDLEAQQKQQEQKADEHANDDNATNGQVPLGDSNVDPDHNHDSHDSSAAAPTGPKIVRTTPPEKQDPAVRFRKAKEEGKVNDEWGVGEGGYKIPKTPGERMRKNVPYKYKFRRNWGDF